MQKEAKARIKINKLLEQAGWRFFSDEKGPANISLEGNVKFDELGENFEKAGRGFVDYLLTDNEGFPVCVLEAKSEDKDPLTGKEQARNYAKSQKVRFVILSNGNVHYLWDMEHGNPTRISHFPSIDTLKTRKRFIPDTDRLVREDVGRDYIVLTQNPYYQEDPRWKDESLREQLIADANLLFLRDYQLEAVKTIQKAVSSGKNRFLFEMATGTGKTLTAAAIIKLYLRSNNAKRVLFLVDRLELENQAKRDLIAYLKPDYSTVVFKENRDDWRKAEPLSGIFCYRIDLTKKNLLRRFGYNYDRHTEAFVNDPTLDLAYPHIDFLVSLDRDNEENRLFLRKDTSTNRYVLTYEYPTIKNLFSLIQSLVLVS